MATTEGNEGQGQPEAAPPFFLKIFPVPRSGTPAFENPIKRTLFNIRFPLWGTGGGRAVVFWCRLPVIEGAKPEGASRQMAAARAGRVGRWSEVATVWACVEGGKGLALQIYPSVRGWWGLSRRARIYAGFGRGRDQIR